jgi:hypothetical protein
MFNAFQRGCVALYFIKYKLWGADLLWLWKKGPKRNSITLSELQSAITDEVKKSVPGCETFVGVIVRKQTPKSRFDTNWAVRGLMFGKADRDKSGKAVATIVERMQREFKLSEDPHVQKDRH